MKNKILVAFVAFFSVSLCFGANGARYFSLDEAFETSEFKNSLDANIKYEFGSGSSANIIRSGFTARQGAYLKDVSLGVNGTPKPIELAEKMACQKALLKALLRFERRAKKMGASKVVNIISYYHQTKFDDKNKFMCWMIDDVARVSLQGDVAN